MDIDRLALGDFIRERREAIRPRMSQLALARRIGRSRPWVTQLERGHEGVMLEAGVLQAIAEALNIPPAEILRLSGASLPDVEPGQLSWLAEQLDKRNRRLLIAIGHELLQEQQSQPQSEGPRGDRQPPRKMGSPTQ